VIADWSSLTRNEHIASLIIDARHRPDATHDPVTALTRLRYHYPDEYQMARAGDLNDMIDRFEEKHPVNPTRVPNKE
jgi:hypothetical protein